MLRVRTAPTLLICILLLLAACGGAEDPEVEETPAGGDAATATATQEPTASEEPTSESGSESESEPAQAADGDCQAELAASHPEAADFYDGASMKFIIPSDPGGGYDTYSRLVIPYLERYTKATIVPENQSGAGGLVAANTLFNSAADDGTVIGMLQGLGAGIAQLAGAEGAQFDLQEFGWVGRVGGLPQIVEARVDGPITDVESLLNVPDGSEIVLGATGPGAAAYVSLTVLEDVLDFPHRWVTGFGGSGELKTAMLQGDIDLTTNSMDSAIASIEAGDTVAIVSLGLESNDFMPDVPVAHELEQLDEDASAILKTHANADALGRPVVAPAGVPEDRLTFLQDALACAMEDPELVELAVSSDRPLAFASGEEMAEIATAVVNSPQRYKDLVIQSYGG